MRTLYPKEVGGQKDVERVRTSTAIDGRDINPPLSCSTFSSARAN
tara:strand:+ start:2647 stop:2781 length:135 start_codon:yes stop_codon:yes gene_type:complete